MKIIFIIILFVIVIGIASNIFYFLFRNNTTPITQQVQVNEINNFSTLVDFSKINPEFLFSAEIPKEFEVEYISQLKAVNIYNPVLSRKNNIENSQLYISFFKASKFLTLHTVNITKQDKCFARS